MLHNIATLLMFHCIVFTLYSGYALWHCSCYTTLYIACFIALFLRFIAVVMPSDIVHVTQHCTLLVSLPDYNNPIIIYYYYNPRININSPVALFLRFIAVVMPCDIVHVTQHCTLLMFHCIVFTLYSGCYALWHCSCYTTLYIAYVSLHCFYAL